MAFALLATAAGAQSINVSNAYEQQNRGYLKKAKGFIDQAVQHESTSTSAQAWFYRTMIYCKIGGAIKDNTKQGKELATLCPEWYRDAYVSALSWKQYDTKGEYTEKISLFIPYVGNVYYDLADKALEAKDYTKSIAYCDTAITLFNIEGKQYLQQCYHLAGVAAQNSGNNELVKKYFNYLVRTKYKNDQIYEILFNIYSQEKDTVNAMKLATNYRKAFPDKYQSDMLMARAYLVNGNFDKSKECMTAALGKVQDVDQKAALLCNVAAVYEMTNDFEEAEKNYNESLTLVANQFNANFNMGKMFYNRAADKLTAANDVPPTDESGLYEKLFEEAKGLFRQSITYLNSAIAYIDGLDENLKSRNQANLYNCLNALKTAYLRLEMNDEFMATDARLKTVKVNQ